MSGEQAVSRPSTEVLRRRAHSLNALAFVLLVSPLVMGALTSAWWVDVLREPSRGSVIVAVFVGAVLAALASGGLAALAGGVVLHAIADSQDAGHRSTDVAT